MVITKLILHKYKRLNLNSIETLTYELDKSNASIHILLGANSSGKSSVLYELSPLPANLKKDYKEDGYKEIHIKDSNHTYVITSGVVGKNKHSFICDGVELNSAGIIKTQHELVKEHFNLTPHIHSILLGLSKFTIMSLSERKKWLTHVSHIDYTYPIKVYEKLKSRHRDITGALRLTNNKLLQDDINTLKKEDRDKLENDLKVLNELVDIYTREQVTITTTNTDSLEKLGKLITIGRSLLKQVVSTDISNPEKELNDINIKLAMVKDKIVTISKQLDGLVELENVSNEDEYIKRKEELVNILKDITSKNIYKLDLNKIDDIISTYKNNYHNLVELLTDVYENKIKYTKSNYEDLQDKLQSYRDKIDAVKRIIDKLEVEDSVLKEANMKDAIACVKCGHEWKLNYDEDKHSKIVSYLDTKRKQLEELMTTYNNLNSQYEAMVNKRNSLISIKNFINSSSILKTLYDNVISNHNLQDDVNLILENLNSASIVLDSLKDYTKYNKELEDVCKKLDIIKANNELRSKLQILDKEKLNLELAKAISYRDELTKKIDTIKSYQDKLDKLSRIYQAIKNNLRSVNKLKEAEINKVTNEHLNEAISLLKQEISRIMMLIKSDDIIKDRTATLNKEIATYKKQEKVLKILVKELSPTEGLIATSINSFLNLFIKDMNSVINGIWSYDVKIESCNLEDGDLDYKFPVTINNGERVIDISLCSSGLKEAIDLAFKVVFMKYLNLDLPLYLDEYGITYDTNHRVAAYNAIESILAPNFDQVFLISHFQSMYARFTNSDISVLTPDTLVLDDGLVYNKYLKIK